MNRRRAVVVLSVLSWCLGIGAGVRADDDVDFNRDVRPILSDKCFKCHGPDEKARQGELRLDLEAAARKVLSPDKPAASELLRRITSSDPDDRMPPPEKQTAVGGTGARSTPSRCSGARPESSSVQTRARTTDGKDMGRWTGPICTGDRAEWRAGLRGGSEDPRLHTNRSPMRRGTLTADGYRALGRRILHGERIGQRDARHPARAQCLE